MIESLHSLAFSIQANPGVYAVMLGSGVSRAAKIPTGWDITLELVRRLARLSGAECDSNPAEWYFQQFGCEPDYSKLLDAVAKTPAERQQLLHGFFEATEQEREEGHKQPTQAHRALAGLVAGGFIKVIITTNFDRLMERALEEVGVTPDVISSKDHIAGAMPLIHSRCCVVKVHGDYKDTRILNTPEELASYSDELNNYLDRIFDEFGIITCGWSAEYDDALRYALTRAPNRRFSTYWAAMGEPKDHAKDLIQHRKAQLVPIKGADQFFGSLAELVESLEAYSRPHPLSTDAAVASLKRYLSEDRFRIQLADLVSREVESVVNSTTGPAFAVMGHPAPTPKTFTARIKIYEFACTTLVAMATVGGTWADESHPPIWEKALGRLANVPREHGGGSYYPAWFDLHRYPATLLFYALGISAVEAGRLDFLMKLMSVKLSEDNGVDKTALKALSPYSMFENPEQLSQLLEGKQGNFAPLNDWIAERLRPSFQEIIPDDKQYELAFDRFEIILALAFATKDPEEKDWIPPGAFGYRFRNRTYIWDEIQASITEFGYGSPYITSGILSHDDDLRDKARARFKDMITQLRWR